jgi:hypothetical protein
LVARRSLTVNNTSTSIEEKARGPTELLRSKTAEHASLKQEIERLLGVMSQATVRENELCDRNKEQSVVTGARDGAHG